MSQEGKPDFYTQKGYQMRSQHALTGAMEDYLEMICRQAEADGCARIGLLAEGLNVRPSSASKMVYQLRTLGLVAFEKYGLIQPTEKGWSVGRWLLHRGACFRIASEMSRGDCQPLGDAVYWGHN